MHIRTFFCSGAAIISMLAPAHAQAREASFAINAGALAPALTAFSRTAAIDIIADPALLRNRKTNGLRGNFTNASGLSRLLRGSGLTYQQRNGSFVIVEAPRPTPKARSLGNAPAPTPVSVEEVKAGEIYGEEILVTGTRGANQDAIAIKRRERGIVDAISSDEAQRLPDLTIINAIRRIPGVSVLPVSDNEHPRDEAISPVLRGLNQSYNNVTINGLPVASPGTPLSGSGSAGRGVRLDILPTSLVKQIVVVKTFTADLDPNAVGGAVDLRTRSAFDQGGKPFLVVDAGIANTSEKGLPTRQDDFGTRLSVTASTTFGADRNLGIVLSGNYQRLENYTEVHATTDSVFYNFYDDNGVRVTNNTLGNGIAVPQQDKSWYNQNDRERWSITGKLEGEFGDVKLFGLLGYYRFTDQYDRNEIIINGRNASITNQTPTSGTYAGASAEVGYRTGATISTTRLAQAGIEWRPSDVDLLTIKGSLSKATSREPHDMVKFSAGMNSSGTVIALPQLGFDYDTSQFHHSFNVDPDAYYDLSLYGGDYWRKIERNVGGKTADIRLDYRHNIDGEGFGFGAGADYVENRAWYSIYRDQYKITDFSYTLADVGQISEAPLSFNRSGIRVLTIDNDRAWGIFNQNPGLFIMSDSSGSNNQDNFNHKEKSLSGYAMLSYNRGPLKMLAGLHGERTKLTTEGRIREQGVWGPIVTSSDYSFLLPSILGSYDLSPDLRLRAGFSQTIGRPSYEAYAARTSINFQNENDIGDPDAFNVSVNIGNPDIKPRKADNFDLSVEWNLSNQYGGLISAGLFHKNIRDEIYSAISQGFTYDNVTYKNATVTQPANASSAKISGIELAAIVNSLEFIAPVFSGFGLSANLSFMDGEMVVPVSGASHRKVDRLLGQPDQIRNLSVFYTNGGFELRGAYNWTGRALREVVPGIAWQDIYWAPRKQFDLQARYDVRPGLSLVAEVSNITKERIDSVTGPGRNLLKDSYSTPRTAWLSINWTPGR